MSDSYRPCKLQHARPPCPSPTPGVHPNPRPLSQWYHPTISSSVVPFSFCPQSLPASGSFPMSQLFPSGGQSIGVSASTSVLPMNIQEWFPLWWTGWISVHCKGLSRVFSSITVQKHQFFGTQPSLWSSSHIHTWLLGKTIALTVWKSNQSILKEINPQYLLEGLLLKLKLQNIGHLMQRADPLGKPLVLGKTESRKRREQQRMRWLDDITDSMDVSLS